MDNIFYMYSNMDSSSQILIFLIILVGLMLVSILVINHITRKKNEKYNNRFHRVDKYSNYSKEKESKRSILNIEKPIVKEDVTPKKVVEEKIEIIRFDDKPKVVNKVVELPKIEEEPEVIEIISDDSSIDKISELLEDNINNPKPIDLTRYEAEEEKNAIISYDELVKAAGAKKIVYKTDEEVEKLYEPVKKVEDVKGKFRASQIISPIYGVQKEKKEEKNELEEFIEIEDIPITNNSTSLTDDEMQKDITFLTNLKTFRSNLD